MPNIKQVDFSGGLNLLSEDIAISNNQYRLANNVRSRYGSIVPIKSPLLINTPAGKKQGGIIAGNFIVIFIGGRAFYKSLYSDVDEEWTMIIGFSMDADVDTIYCTAVPNATSTAIRKLTTSTDITSNVKLDSSMLSGSLACLVCQDGINQPRLIFADGTSRIAHSYFQWSIANREYVPIGKQMMYFNGILFIESPDSKSIYRSVSGRPLDFVVNITSTGNKGGDASTTSFAVDYNNITCIQALNTDAFFVGTAYRCYSVKLDYDNKIWGEPQFTITFLYNTGVINHKCFTEALGDFCFIDFDGLRSFNAVSQLLSEGRNSVFSQNLEKLFTGISQDSKTACVISFNNYIFFSAKTIYGNCIIVFDTLAKVFTSVDLHEASNVKQFLSSYNEYEQCLYVLTESNKLYKLESGTTNETAVVFTKAWIVSDDADSTQNQIKEHRTHSTKMQFRDGSVDGDLDITEYVDGIRSFDKSDIIKSASASISFPIKFPIVADTEQDLYTLTLVPTNKTNLTGYKISYAIVWNTDAALVAISVESNEIDKPTFRQQSSLTHK